LPASPEQRSWTYVADHRRKPHVHPLRTPSGACLTRVEPPDHPWHRGLWFVVKFVDGANFWEELAPYGVQRHRDPTTIDWIGPDRETVVLEERRRLAHVDLGVDEAYALDVDVELRPAADVVLDRTPYSPEHGWGGYSGLALRGRADWVDTRLLLDDGSGPHDRLLGVRSRWCDLSGAVDGTTGGVAVLDAPTNPGHPVPWYASTRAATYGDDGWSNFLNAAFLWDGPREVAGGDVLRFAYRVVVHDGAWDGARIESCYRRWVDA